MRPRRPFRRRWQPSPMTDAAARGDGCGGTRQAMRRSDGRCATRCGRGGPCRRHGCRRRSAPPPAAPAPAVPAPPAAPEVATWVAPADDDDGALHDARGHGGEGDDGSGAALQHREIGAGSADAEHERQQYEGEPARDLLASAATIEAPGAFAEVGFQLAAVAVPRLPRGMRRDARSSTRTTEPGGRAQVRLDPRLAQAFAGAEGQLGVAPGLMPSSGAISAGFICSISEYQSTSCQRDGKAAERLRGKALVERLVRAPARSRTDPRRCRTRPWTISRRARPQPAAVLRMLVNR